ncbi:MAG: PAS domain-containing protein [Ilumatobacteraceae bacterium]
MTTVHGSRGGLGEPVEEWHESWTELEREWEVERRASSSVMTVHDPSGRVLYVTPGARTVFGVDDEAKLLGRNLTGLVHPDDVDRVRRAFCGWMSGRSSAAIVLRIAARDGGWATIEAIGTREGSASTGLTVVITAHECDAADSGADATRSTRSGRSVRPCACGGLDARSRRTPRR